MIASALSVPDPRERPLEKQQAADQAHLRFRDERSDFLSLLALWEFFDAQARARSSRIAGWSTPAARSSCPTCACASGATCTRSSRREVAEQGWKWDAGAAARRSIARALRGDPPGAARGAPRQHRQQGRGRRGLPRRARHPLPPASRAPGSRRRAPKWVLAAELVETSRLYARCAGEDRAGVDRGGRRRPRDARLLRAALGRRARRGRRERARARSTA